MINLNHHTVIVKAVLRLEHCLRKLRPLIFPKNTFRGRLYYKYKTLFRTKVKLNNNGIPVRLHSENPKKNSHGVTSIIVIKGDMIGDFILAIPVIQWLKTRFKNAKITLVCSAWNQAFASETNLFDQIIVAPLDSREQNDNTEKKQMYEAINILKMLPHYDIAIDLKVEPITRFALLQINADLKAGFYAPNFSRDEHPNSIVLPSLSDNTTNLHNQDLLYLLAYAVSLNFSHLDNTSSSPSLLNKIAQKHAATRESLYSNSSTELLIGINTGAGAQIRCWPIDYFVTLCKKILEHLPAKIVLFGAESQLSDAQKITSSIRSDKIVNFVGKISLSEFLGTLPILDLYIGHDTGTTHLAAATDCNTLCLYAGVTLQDRFKPRGKYASIAFADIPCSPCGLTEVKSCPYNHACMTSISVDYVFDKISCLLTWP